MTDQHYFQKPKKKNVWHNVKATLNWMAILVFSLWANSLLAVELTPAVRPDANCNLDQVFPLMLQPKDEFSLHISGPGKKLPLKQKESRYSPDVNTGWEWKKTTHIYFRLPLIITLDSERTLYRSGWSS